MLEQMCHSESIFVTLTYDKDNLPEDHSVDPKQFRNWIRRLRRVLSPQKFRYFGVGEYGDETNRPHYHCMLFGVDWAVGDAVLAATWPFGNVHIGEVNSTTARYIAGYVVKKLYNDKDPYVVNVLAGRHPEFMRCSAGSEGGIGLPGVKLLAKKLQESKYYKPRVLMEVNHGRRKLPLGRYLREKLNKATGVTEDQLMEQCLDYQDELLAKHMQDGDDDYYKRVVAEHNERCKQQHKRLAIHKSKRRL
jgi:hypothetical protein